MIQIPENYKLKSSSEKTEFAKIVNSLEQVLPSENYILGFLKESDERLVLSSVEDGDLQRSMAWVCKRLGLKLEKDIKDLMQKKLGDAEYQDDVVAVKNSVVSALLFIWSETLKTQPCKLELDRFPWGETSIDEAVQGILPLQYFKGYLTNFLDSQAATDLAMHIAKNMVYVLETTGSLELNVGKDNQGIYKIKLFKSSFLLPDYMICKEYDITATM